VSDPLDALANEATTAPDVPLYEREMYGRVWSFGRPDIRPARLRAYAALARKVDTDKATGADAIELAACAEDILRSALPRAERHAFDAAPFDGTDIDDLARGYFAAVGIGPGESSASPAPSPTTLAPSRPTPRRRTRRR